MRDVNTYNPLTLIINKYRLAAKIAFAAALGSKVMSDQEEKIERRLSEIDAAIEELSAERRALQNLLYMDVIEEKGRGVKNTRSYKRIYNEEKIKQVISNNPRGLNIRQIYNALSRMGISLKDSTIRSHLSRMRKRGEVFYSSSSQNWLLPVSPDSEQSS